MTQTHSIILTKGERKKERNGIHTRIFTRNTNQTKPKIEFISSFSRHAERSNFHRSGNNEGSFRGVGVCIFVVHEPALHNGFIPGHYFVTVAALKSLLILVTLMCAVLHLLKVPYHAELAHCCHQMFFLFPTFSNLKYCISYNGTNSIK